MAGAEADPDVPVLDADWAVLDVPGLLTLKIAPPTPEISFARLCFGGGAGALRASPGTAADPSISGFAPGGTIRGRSAGGMMRLLGGGPKAIAGAVGAVLVVVASAVDAAGASPLGFGGARCGFFGMRFAFASRAEAFAAWSIVSCRAAAAELAAMLCRPASPSACRALASGSSLLDALLASEARSILAASHPAIVPRVPPARGSASGVATVAS